MIDNPHNRSEKFACQLTDAIVGIGEEVKEVLLSGLSAAVHGRWFVKLGALAAVLGLIWLFYEADYIDKNKPPVTYEVLVETDMSPAVMTSSYRTEVKTIGEFMAENDIGYASDTDLIDVDPDKLIKEDIVIHIKKPITVHIHVDGGTKDYTAQEGFTVSDALEALDIRLGELDILSGELDETMANGDEFTIQRVKYKFEYEEEEIPFKTEIVSDKKLTCGKVETFRKGKKGVKTKTFIVVTIDGKVQSRFQTDEKVTKKPKNKVIHYGLMIDKSVPEGLQYEKKLSHCKCVSYNYSAQRYGVYGLPCDYGTCAVDRSLIPLGSKLYVAGYGYCIANDVGTAIKGKKLDLYMPVRAQCGVWGAQWCDVYIISYGSDVKFEAYKK